MIMISGEAIVNMRTWRREKTNDDKREFIMLRVKHETNEIIIMKQWSKI